MKFSYNGRYMWHGTMITDGGESPFAVFADTMADAVAAFDTLPEDAEVIALERGQDMNGADIEVDNPKLEEAMEKARKKALN